MGIRARNGASGPAWRVRVALVTLVMMASGLAAGAPGGLDPAPSQGIDPQWLAGEHRQFDFWVGEWDVNLRIQREDASWVDAKKSRAKIYRILDGKAILELWDEKKEGLDAIRGYSLRHYDPAREEWVLYLNWPGRNRSGTSDLAGAFRHGRGEFFSVRESQDGGKTISRYTFSDIAEDRLRWDDGYSKDGGITWKGNWIMEFTRAAPMAEWPGEGETAHTYHTGERCDLSGFRQVERLAGEFRGELSLHGDDGGEETVPAALIGHKVLDGCAVISFLEFPADGEVRNEFRLSTWNTHAGLFEETLLDDRPGTPARLMYGPGQEDGSIRMQTRKEVTPAWRTTWGEGDGGEITLRVEEADGEEGWVLRREAVFTRK